VPRALSAVCLLGAAVAAGSALAQQPGRATHPPPPTRLQQRPAPPPGKVAHFHKPADASAVVPAQAKVPALPAGTGLPVVPVPVPDVELPAFVARQPDKKDEKKGGPDNKLPTKEEIEQYTKLEGPERIFAMPDDETMQRVIRDKMIKDNPATDKNLQFPPLPPVGAGVVYAPKTSDYPPMQAQYAPLYVVHRRLHFEDRNTERQGWDLGIIQPAVSAVLFYKDVFMWPQSLASGCAYGFWDTNAGKCLPGSPTPYLLYPPGLTITGSVFETVMVTGLAFAIP
jgi:hypothetical protein